VGIRRIVQRLFPRRGKPKNVQSPGPDIPLHRCVCLVRRPMQYRVCVCRAIEVVVNDQCFHVWEVAIANVTSRNRHSYLPMRRMVDSGKNSHAMRHNLLFQPSHRFLRPEVAWNTRKALHAARVFVVSAICSHKEDNLRIEML
jgi:hypothetical protein